MVVLSLVAVHCTEYNEPAFFTIINLYTDGLGLKVIKRGIERNTTVIMMHKFSICHSTVLIIGYLYKT